MTDPPSTFVVGAGPVAIALAGGWRRHGGDVIGLWARRAEVAAAAATSAGVAGFSGPWPAALTRADAIVIAVRDEAIAEVAAQLCQAGRIHEQQVMLHCAGVIAAAEALAPALGQVGGVATLHPLRAIADGDQTARSWPGTVFGVEGDSRGREVARRLVEVLGGRPLMLAATEMARYHAAAVMAANYVVTLIDAAAGTLGRQADREVVAALCGLATGALDNVREHGVEAGLTGPIRRGDLATVRRHLAALPVDQGRLYRCLGRRTVDIARRAGAVDPAALAALSALLSTDDDAE